MSVKHIRSDSPSLFDLDIFKKDEICFQENVPVGESTKRRVLDSRSGMRTKEDLLDDATIVVKALKEVGEDSCDPRPKNERPNFEVGRFWSLYDYSVAKNLLDNTSQEWQDLRDSLNAAVGNRGTEALRTVMTMRQRPKEAVIESLWEAIRKLGFTGGLVLDASTEPGALLRYAPQEIMVNTIVRTISTEQEGNYVLSRTKPKWDVVRASISSVKLGEKYDLIVAVTSASRKTVKTYEKAGRLCLPHYDYEVLKYVSALREDGICAVVVPYSTMDGDSDILRSRVASIAKLEMAVRFPQSDEEKGYDLLLFKKFGDSETGDTTWTQTKKTTTANGKTVTVNTHFANTPSLVLDPRPAGKNEKTESYSRTPVAETEPQDLFAKIVATMPCVSKVKQDEKFTHTSNDIASSTSVREGNFVLDSKDRLCQVEERVLRPLLVRSQHGTGLDKRSVSVVRSFIPIREALQEVLALQSADLDSASAQLKLGNAYEEFVEEFGAINLKKIVQITNPETKILTDIVRRPNIEPFMSDPSCYLVSSIEEYDEETNIASRGAIFTEKIVRKAKVQNVETSTEALVASLQVKGNVDIAYMATLLNVTEEAVVTSLKTKIYEVPGYVGQKVYQTSDEYLSGKIRQKLTVAEEASKYEPRFAENVKSLQEIIPMDLGPGDITARLGTPWIPVSDVERFISDTVGVVTKVSHEDEVASWNVERYPFAGSAKAIDWSTSRRSGADLINDALNSKIPVVYDTTYDSQKKRHVKVNPVETEAAKDKLAAIHTAFEEWIWKDAARASRLVKYYNENYNDLVPRSFDGSHLEVENLSTKVNLYDTQKRAIWRIVSSGNTYVNHSVGSGKSRTIAAAIQIQQRLGLVTKPLILVPGHCIVQFSREYFQTFPTANILVADEVIFSNKNRRKFAARAATGQWDAIIMSHSAFMHIAPPRDFEESLISKLVDDMDRLIEAAGRSNSDRRTCRAMIARKRMFEKQVEDMRLERDDDLDIRELGIDQIIVDEAQAYRKLSFNTNSTNLKGVDPDGSKKAWDLYVKSRYVETINPGRSLVMASGTAITNTLAELYTISRFMDEKVLRERKVHEFDAWAANFGKTVTELELQPNGFYKPVTRFSQFVNIPEMMAMYRQTADVVMKEELHKFVHLPTIKEGGRQIRTSRPSEAFRHYQTVLDDRMGSITRRGGVGKKGSDILLSVINDGRHAAIDMRMVDKSAENEPNNKLNDLIDNVHSIWMRTSEKQYSDGGLPGSTQMIFSDIGTFGVERTRGFSAYGWIEKRLIDLGVPAEQIRFVQKCKNSNEKQALFNDFNAGKVRIMIGSSETMGTGVNAQRRLIALHHLDVPWLPSQIEQREGRIERKGNENPEVEIFAYATVGSYDATGWQVVERKQRFIEMAFKGDGSVRKVEDINSESNQFAMAKAIASGDQRLVQKAGLEMEIARLQRKSAGHKDQEHSVRVRLERAKEDLKKAQEQSKLIRVDLATRKITTGTAFYAVVGGRQYTARTSANEALLAEVQKNVVAAKQSNDHIFTSDVGNIGGFNISTTFDRRTSDLFGQRWMTIKFAHQHEGVQVESEMGGWGNRYGLVTKIERRIQDLDERCRDYDFRITKLTDQVTEYETRGVRKFEFTAELEEKRRQLAEIDRSLAEGKPAATP